MKLPRDVETELMYQETEDQVQELSKSLFANWRWMKKERDYPEVTEKEVNQLIDDWYMN